MIREVFLGLGLLLSAGSANAVWFGLKTEPFDPNVGLTDYPVAWEKGQRVGILHGMGGAPIGPHWLITAGHLTGSTIFDYKMGAHGNGSYHIVETVAHPNYPRVDLRLYRVKEAFPDYAPLLKTPPASNEALTIYGRGKSAPTIPLKLNDRIFGWSQDKWRDGKEGLRAGTITNHTYASFQEAKLIKWSLDAGPGTAYGDSGHPIFSGEFLAGVIANAPAFIYYRTNASGPCTNAGYVFDDAGINTCGNPPAETKASTAAFDLTRYLPWIYDTISPPVRRSASQSGIIPGWSALAAEGTATHNSRQLAALDVSTPSNGIPATLYQSMLYRRGRPIELKEGNLLKTEPYTVRLHFAALRFSGPGQIRQKIVINGVERAAKHDPFAAEGQGKGSMVEFKGIKPDEKNTITIRLIPLTNRKYAAVSGVEIVQER